MSTTCTTQAARDRAAALTVYVVSWEFSCGSIDGEVGGVVGVHATEAGAIASAWACAAEWQHDAVNVILVPVLPLGSREAGPVGGKRIVFTPEADRDNPDTWEEEAEDWDVCYDVGTYEVQS
jgi:hypothetical protein